MTKKDVVYLIGMLFVEAFVVGIFVILLFLATANGSDKEKNDYSKPVNINLEFENVYNKKLDKPSQFTAIPSTNTGQENSFYVHHVTGTDALYFRFPRPTSWRSLGNPESFCQTTSDISISTTVTCPLAKVFIGPIFGGSFFNTTLDPCASVSVGGSATPLPNVRLDDDANAAVTSFHWVTTGCNGKNSCVVNTGGSSTPGVYIGTCF